MNVIFNTIIALKGGGVFDFVFRPFLCFKLPSPINLKRRKILVTTAKFLQLS